MAELKDDLVEGSGSGEVPMSNDTDPDNADGRNDNLSIFAGEGEDSERKPARQRLPKKKIPINENTNKLLKMQKTREKTVQYLRNMEKFYLK